MNFKTLSLVLLVSTKLFAAESDWRKTASEIVKKTGNIVKEYPHDIAIIGAAATYAASATVRSAVNEKISGAYNYVKSEFKRDVYGTSAKAIVLAGLTYKIASKTIQYLDSPLSRQEDYLWAVGHLHNGAQTVSNAYESTINAVKTHKNIIMGAGAVAGAAGLVYIGKKAYDKYYTPNTEAVTLQTAKGLTSNGDVIGENTPEQSLEILAAMFDQFVQNLTSEQYDYMVNNNIQELTIDLVLSDDNFKKLLTADQQEIIGSMLDFCQK